MNKKTLTSLDYSGKRVLVRVDFNVPVENGAVSDTTRIDAALPTLNHILDKGGSLVLMSHLGRPKGGPDAKYSLAPVVPVLAAALGREVIFVPNCVGADAEAAAANLQPGGVILLENLRFHPEEEGKGVSAEQQLAFAGQLAALGDVFVNDAFGTAHRAHASMTPITTFFPEKAVAGLLLEKEINYLAKTLESPERPFVAIIGGAKISGKIDVILNLLGKVNSLIIGGGMAYTFFRAQGLSIGNSIVEDDKVDLARDIMKQATDRGVQLLLPTDTMVADDFSPTANRKVVGLGGIEDGWEGLDIGPESAATFADVIRNAKTVVWNGPMGCFEMEPFAVGTATVAKALAETECVSIVGGGDSVSAINQLGLAERITHISTGGGASLELLEGKVLPGLAALSDA